MNLGEALMPLLEKVADQLSNMSKEEVEKYLLDLGISIEDIKQCLDE